MNWRELPDFKDIDLHDSWVLSWRYCDDQLSFELEASIWPSSEYYEMPKTNKYTCYKYAKLAFKDFSSINGILNMSDVKPYIGPDGEKDFGNIDNLEVTKDGFRIDGNFGSVIIFGGVMCFNIGT